MSNLALYTVADQYLSDIRDLEELDLGQEEFEDKLANLSGELADKATAVAMFVRNIEATVDAMKQAEKQIADRRKAKEAKAERIRSYLLENMLRIGISKIDTPYFSLSVRKNPPAVEVINLDAIPDEYLDIPPLPQPVLNKNRLKDDLKNGVIVEGARLTAGHSLQIK